MVVLSIYIYIQTPHNDVLGKEEKEEEEDTQPSCLKEIKIFTFEFEVLIAHLYYFAFY